MALVKSQKNVAYSPNHENGCAFERRKPKEDVK